MSANKTTPQTVNKVWWIWNRRVLEFMAFSINASPVRFPKTPDTAWYMAENPLSLGDPERRWMIAEGGTGYVLAFGSSPETCKRNGALKFTKDKTNYSQADIKALIRGQQAILRRFLAAGIEIPQPEKVIITEPEKTRLFQKNL